MPALPPDMARVEVARYFDGDGATDPLGLLPREYPQDSDVEVRRRERTHDGGRQLLPRFSCSS